MNVMNEVWQDGIIKHETHMKSYDLSLIGGLIKILKIKKHDSLFFFKELRRMILENLGPNTKNLEFSLNALQKMNRKITLGNNNKNYAMLLKTD